MILFATIAIKWKLIGTIVGLLGVLACVIGWKRLGDRGNAMIHGPPNPNPRIDDRPDEAVRLLIFSGCCSALGLLILVGIIILWLAF